MKKLKDKIKEIVKNVYRDLGGGEFLKEEEFQRALAVAFKKHNLKYLRETNIELIYMGESIRAEGGEVDFIVFDEKEENGILLETKREDPKDDTYGKGAHQAWIYLKSIKDEKSALPNFLKEKIKCALVINFAKETKEIGELLNEEVGRESVKEKEEIKKDYADVEIWDIRTKLTEEKDKAKKKKQKEKQPSGE